MFATIANKFKHHRCDLNEYVIDVVIRIHIYSYYASSSVVVIPMAYLVDRVSESILSRVFAHKRRNDRKRLIQPLFALYAFFDIDWRASFLSELLVTFLELENILVRLLNTCTIKYYIVCGSELEGLFLPLSNCRCPSQPSTVFEDVFSKITFLN